MCCSSTIADTKKLTRRFRGGTKLRLWKVYESYRSGLNSTVMGTCVRQAGWIRSNRARRGKDRQDDGPEIARGIHVFKTCHKAKDSFYRMTCVIVPVTCYLKDLVGASGETAVFMKVFLARKDFDKAVGNHK